MTLGAVGSNSDSIRRVGICVLRYFVALPIQSPHIDLVKNVLFSHLTLYPVLSDGGYSDSYQRNQF
jgi:hypothetical protein